MMHVVGQGRRFRSATATLVAGTMTVATMVVSPTVSFAAETVQPTAVDRVFVTSTNFTVPAGVSSVELFVAGASGGRTDSGSGGRGALVSARTAVHGGQVLNLVVGQIGTSVTTAIPGGTGGSPTGAHGGNGTQLSGGGAGGGGASVVTLPNGHLVVAGGGGGAGAEGGSGGDAGAFANGSGQDGQNAHSEGGAGATVNGRGSGGASAGASAVAGSPGSGPNGGQGGSGAYGGGGGGGGYFGGGGGGGSNPPDLSNPAAGGGGAGSSFATPGTFTNVVIDRVNAFASGQIALRYTVGALTPQTANQGCVVQPKKKAFRSGTRPVVLKPKCRTNAGQRVGVHLTKLKGKGRVAKLICQTGKQHKRNRHTKPRSTNHGHICAKGNLRVHVTKGKGRVQVRWSAPATGNFAALTQTRNYQLRH